MKRLPLIGLLLISAFSRADKIDDLILRTMKSQQVPGLTLGIVKNGRLISKRAYGFSDLEQNVKTNADDLFEVGSVTKQFTAFATFMLIEQGKIALDDPISKYLPESPPAWSGIKVRNLLYQTSGLQDYALVPGLGLIEQFDRAKFLSTMTTKPLDFQPGAAWAYSNTNYALLGWIIEKASGQPYIKFMTENVLKPVGMTHSLFEDPDQITPHRAHGYYKGDKLIRATPSAASINSDGTLMSNIDDMVKWDAALAARKILSAESYSQIWSPAILNRGRKRLYGAGWFLAQYKAPAYVGHPGNSSGYSAGIARYTDAKLTVIVLCNVYAISAEGLAKSVAELVDPSLKPAIPSPVADHDPTRTERIRLALTKLGAGDADENVLDPDLSVLLKTERAKTFGLYPQLKKLETLSYAGEEPLGNDTLITYRVGASGKMYTAFLLWSSGGRLAQLIMRPDA